MRKLRANAIDTASYLATAVGKEKFAAHAQQVLGLMHQIETSNDDNDDGSRRQMLGAWARVAKCLGADFAPYLPTVMQRLIALISSEEDVVEVGQDATEGASADGTVHTFRVALGGLVDKKVELHTSKMEEKGHAMQLALGFVDSLPTKTMHQYYGQLLNDLKRHITYPYSAEIRVLSGKLLAAMFKAYVSDLNAPEEKMETGLDKSTLVNGLCDLSELVSVVFVAAQSELDDEHVQSLWEVVLDICKHCPRGWFDPAFKSVFIGEDEAAHLSGTPLYVPEGQKAPLRAQIPVPAEKAEGREAAGQLLCISLMDAFKQGMKKRKDIAAEMAEFDEDDEEFEELQESDEQQRGVVDVLTDVMIACCDLACPRLFVEMTSKQLMSVLLRIITPSAGKRKKPNKKQRAKGKKATHVEEDDGIQDEFMVRMVICVLAAYVEAASRECQDIAAQCNVANIIDLFIYHLLRGMESQSDPSILQAAAYAIGLSFEYAADVVSTRPQIAAALTSLAQLGSLHKHDDEEDDWQTCHANAVSGLMKAAFANVPPEIRNAALAAAIESLPLGGDEHEAARSLHGLFTLIAAGKPEVLGESNKNVPKLAAAFKHSIEEKHFDCEPLQHSIAAWCRSVGVQVTVESS
eukprot:NODE_236_length_2413_cov_15.170474_g183_i0.p2 GENE.NODE_236_length_2413_cov_15.170474_g183_i0~~NODE_236_length_2413_cov_15.170474_g183_i0.p2  ORF type:complete len:669 (-),score=305.34 NODE_236_length_2413_cov_15.170474_g183_i0:405-2306(-)